MARQPIGLDSPANARPVGEQQDERTLARTSPLGSFAAAFAAADLLDHGTFLTNRICNAAAGRADRFASTIRSR